MTRRRITLGRQPLAASVGPGATTRCGPRPSSRNVHQRVLGERCRLGAGVRQQLEASRAAETGDRHGRERRGLFDAVAARTKRWLRVDNPVTRVLVLVLAGRGRGEVHLHLPDDELTLWGK